MEARQRHDRHGVAADAKGISHGTVSRRRPQGGVPQVIAGIAIWHGARVPGLIWGPTNPGIQVVTSTRAPIHHTS